MILETDRLYVVPLTLSQLKMWVEDIKALERDLNCTYDAEPVDGIFLDIVKGQYNTLSKDEKNYLFHTFWFIIRKSDRTVVGSASFKDLPNSNEEVEIGYGLGKKHEHNGYMTESVQSMCRWALSKDSISYIIAETDIDNIQSHNVLKRCGFKKYKNNDAIWWKLSTIS